VGSTITAITTAPANPGTGGLKGLAPSIFYGDRNRSDLFLKEFKQWKLINRNSDEMSNPFNRVLMALSYIKGEKVNNWQEEQLTKLEATTHPHNEEAIWTEFEQAFKDAFTDSNKKQCVLGAQPRKAQVEQRFVVTRHMTRDADTHRLSAFSTKSISLSPYSLTPLEFDLSWSFLI
jgi:hypothetical protein